MTEFVTTSRLADIFSVSTSKNFSVKVLSKQDVTVEVMHLKKSMYNDDPGGFIFKHFDILCNLIRNFGEYDEGLRILSLKVLLQVSEKMVSSLTTFLEEEEFNQDELFKKRNSLKMAVFLLCHFASAFDKDLSKQVMAANIGQGRKKKSTASEEKSEWPENRVKFLVVIKKLFKLPISKLWDPPVVDPEFVNFVTVTFFKLLENADVAKDKGMRTEIYRFLGTVLKEYRTGLVYSVKIVQLIQDFEHLSSVLADGVVYFVKECSADTLVSDILREATLLDVDILAQNLTAAHSLSQFLVSIAEECPEKFLPLVSLILQFLEWESHIMRNCCLSVLGILLSKTLCSEGLSEREKTMRVELLDHVEAHLLDVNSFVRCRSIQVLKMLMEEKALLSAELYKLGKVITKRLWDKASNVRKNAMLFMAEFVQVNQFACQVPRAVLRESYQTELKKLVELKKSVPVIFEDSDEEEAPDKIDKKNAVIFESSDDEDNDKEKDDENEKEKGDASGENSEKRPAPATEATAENEVQKAIEMEVDKDGVTDGNVDSNSSQEAIKVQQSLVDYLKNTLNFSEVIYNIIEPIQVLLHSSTQTDILEAIDFITTIGNSLVKGSELSIKEVLKLVWSKEPTIRDAALNAFKSLYLANEEVACTPKDIAKKLIELLKSSTVDDALCVEEFVKHYSELGDIPKTVSKVLISTLLNSKSELTEEENVSTLLLLGMLAQTQPDVILPQFDSLVDSSLGTEKTFLLTMHAFKALRMVNEKARGKVELDSSLVETRTPHGHLLVSRIKHFLIDGIKNYDDDQWIPMANEAVASIFSLTEEPVMLCAEISKKLADILYEEINLHQANSANTEQEFFLPGSAMTEDEMHLQKVSYILLARYLSFCGHVAIHNTNYLKVDYFASLRRQEALRERRRRRSSMHAHLSPLQSPSFLSPPAKSGKKRKSFHKKYKLVPPVDEETTYEQIIEMCASDAQNPEKLTGALLPAVIACCRWTLKVFNKEVQAAASLALAKFMLLSEQVCQDNMQLFATVAEKSPEAYIRANMIVAMGDLTTAYPNIVEPWTQQIFQRLNDSDSVVRENSITILTHLILHDFVRIKGLISDAAKCIADSNDAVSVVAKHLFAELSKKGNCIYNIIPDIISSLSDPKSGVDEESFQAVMKYILQYIEKEKLVEGLVEKLCYRFTVSSNDIQIHELTFCLSILTLNDKCYSKLMEFKNLLKERMSDPVVMRYITNITANAKKNDAKTAAELETFRKELGI